MSAARASRRESGRAAAFSLGLVAGLLVLGYALVRGLDLLPHGGAAPARSDGPAPVETSEAWSATVALGDARVVARLLPLHDEPALEEFRARSLRERYGLPPGRPWRLYLALEPADSAPVTVRGVRVGNVLRPFAELARAPEGPDPVHALLAMPLAPLEPGRARPLVLWGELPADAVAELVLEADGAAAAGAPLARADDPETGLGPRWYAGMRDLPEPRRASDGLAAEVARLERELEAERARRMTREAAHLEFSRLVAQVPTAREILSPEQLVALGLAETEPTPEELEAAETERVARERARELGTKLSVLMRLEGLRGLDLLETGTLLPGPPPGIGPVVFRCLDERGRLTGSIGAARLRLEGSSAAHTLTLVLEDGFESLGGERVPFADGVRRITLTEVDPEPWQRDCPELFASADAVRTTDDGRWSLADVRRELNRLLALDTRVGWYRLHSLGGVRGRELVDVQLEELEPGGGLTRRLFADRLALVLEDASVVLELSDGASVRGGEKTPFRDGHHRIVLPGVPLDAWRAARLPGIAEPPTREASAADAGGASARPGG